MAKATKKAPAKKASTSSLVEKLRGKMNTLQGKQADGSAVERRKYNYIKLTKEKNKLRILEPENGPALIFYKRHSGKGMGGKFQTALDFRWMVSDDDIVEAMQVRERITPTDLHLIEKYGDPYDVLWRELNKIGQSDEFRKAGIGQKRSLMAVLYEGEVGVLDMSLTFGNNVLDIIDANGEEIISLDEGMPLLVTKTGSGKDTRYGQPVPIFKEKGPVDLEFDDDEPPIPNLYDVLATNCLSYKNKVKFLFRSHAKLVALAGLDPSDFGISNDSENVPKKVEVKGKKKGKVVVTEDDDEDMIDDDSEE